MVGDHTDSDSGILRRIGVSFSALERDQGADEPAAEETAEPADDGEGSSLAEGGPGTDRPTSADEEADTEGPGYELPLDQIFELLKNSRRRETLHYLNENDGEATLSDLAEHIAALENDTTVQAISSSQRKRVYVGLYQCHLPKMDDMDVVEFDQNRGTIEIGPNADQLEPYLDEPDQRPWHKIYMGLTALGGILFAAAHAGGANYGLTPTIVLVVLLVSIVTCSVWHFQETTDED